MTRGPHKTPWWWFPNAGFFWNAEIPRHFMFDFSGWWTPVFLHRFLGGPRLRQRFVLKREDAKQVREIVKTLPIQVVCVLIPPSTNNLLPNHLGPPLKMCFKFPRIRWTNSFWRFYAKYVNFEPLEPVSYLLSPSTNPSGQVVDSQPTNQPATSRWLYPRERPWNWAWWIRVAWWPRVGRPKGRQRQRFQGGGRKGGRTRVLKC